MAPADIISDRRNPLLLLDNDPLELPLELPLAVIVLMAIPGEFVERI